jgi:hypothetical protein
MPVPSPVEGRNRPTKRPGLRAAARGAAAAARVRPPGRATFAKRGVAKILFFRGGRFVALGAQRRGNAWVGRATLGVGLVACVTLARRPGASRAKPGPGVNFRELPARGGEVTGS